jgi:outer membrane scaffolding protein for murein synthesis (MipA/OmpV family)
MSPFRTALMGLVFLVVVSARPAAAQTFEPYPYWMNSAGIILRSLGGPIPEWGVNVEAGATALPVYEGSDRYRVLPSPSFDIRYYDIAFLSMGDGLGVNLLRGDTYRAGVALNYDIGRGQNGRLRGLGNVDAAPELRLFGEYWLVPFVIDVDIRKAFGGHDGIIGDIGAYLPVIGNEKVVLFVGPGLTFADQRYQQAYFGISTAQSQFSALQIPAYRPGGGVKSASLGAVFVYNFNPHWMFEANAGWDRLLGSAGNSPIVQMKDNFGLTTNIGYNF